MVAVVGIEGSTVLVRGLDCLDGTPLVDLKPDRCEFTPRRSRQPGDDQTEPGTACPVPAWSRDGTGSPAVVRGARVRGRAIPDLRPPMSSTPVVPPDPLPLRGPGRRRDGHSQHPGPPRGGGDPGGCALARWVPPSRACSAIPWAPPDLLGASSGAALGAVIGIYLSLGVAGIQVLSFAGGLAAVAGVTIIGHRLRGMDGVLTLVLIGVVVGALLGAGVGLVKTLADPYNQLPAITFWLLGQPVGRHGCRPAVAPSADRCRHARPDRPALAHERHVAAGRRGPFPGPLNGSTADRPRLRGDFSSRRRASRSPASSAGSGLWCRMWPAS